MKKSPKKRTANTQAIADLAGSAADNLTLSEIAMLIDRLTIIVEAGRCAIETPGELLPAHGMVSLPTACELLGQAMAPGANYRPGELKKLTGIPARIVVAALKSNPGRFTHRGKGWWLQTIRRVESA